MILADNNNNKDNDNDGNNNILALPLSIKYLFLQQLWINLEKKDKRFYGSIQDTNVLSFSKFVLKKCPKNINPWEDTNSDRHALEFLV